MAEYDTRTDEALSRLVSTLPSAAAQILVAQLDEALAELMRAPTQPLRALYRRSRRTRRTGAPVAQRPLWDRGRHARPAHSLLATRLVHHP